MNNLNTLRNFFMLNLDDVTKETNLTHEELLAFENGQATPSIATWQSLAEFYANQFHVPGLPDNDEPVHFRLSVDYLMNIGLTMNDLLAMQWYFNNTRPELGEFSLTLYQQNQPIIEERLTDLDMIFKRFAGYLLLNHDGSLNAFIDEKNDNHISDWRLLLYKKDNLMIDLTAELIYFEDLINYTVM
ncbi:transcriptional regulator [Weissella oryzae SG25]|uniref:Transcriptional regulator n=1 Tax=Weissella oryzae (strain DSM 25784 / JCM 18191 / LMG 30913 / SG25) TaxID=1329250 RepID=A0A069CUE6_WEIOS|nr:hypothetical protein [Weissella oryzae]GAK31114.1 transcriptional regulator [Weissella oryzae SG25]